MKAPANEFLLDVQDLHIRYGPAVAVRGVLLHVRRSELVAIIGDGWLVVPIPTLDQFAAQMSLYSSARSAAQLPPSAHICRLLEVGCAPDDDAAFHRIAPYVMEKYKSYFSWGLEGLTLDP